MEQPYAAKMAAIDSNLERFLVKLPELIAQHENEWVLLRHGEVVAFYPEAIDAQIAGNQRFPDELFSIQEVTKRVEHLGFYTYAIAHRPA